MLCTYMYVVSHIAQCDDITELDNSVDNIHYTCTGTFMCGKAR